MQACGANLKQVFGPIYRFLSTCIILRAILFKNTCILLFAFLQNIRHVCFYNLFNIIAFVDCIQLVCLCPHLGGAYRFALVRTSVHVRTSIKVCGKYISKSTGANAFKPYRIIIQHVRLCTWGFTNCQNVFDQSYLPLKMT